MGDVFKALADPTRRTILDELLLEPDEHPAAKPSKDVTSPVLDDTCGNLVQIAALNA